MTIFEIEQEIMKAWHVIDDIQLLNENVMETNMSRDEIANALVGLESIYNMRFQKVFNIFEDLCKEYHAIRKENEKMKTITLKVEDCDQVVIDDLKDAYHMNNQFDKVDCSNDVLEPDYELLKSILTVLAYYMTHEDYEEWVAINPVVKEDD